MPTRTLTIQRITFPMVAFGLATFLSLTLANDSFGQTKAAKDLLKEVEQTGVPRRLWTYTPSVKKLITSRVLKESGKRVKELSKDLEVNAKKVTRHLNFWQMAYFHDFYHKLYGRELKNHLGDVMKDVAMNRKFFGDTKPLKQLRNQWGTSVDSLGVLNRCPEVALKILKRFNKNPKLHNDPSETRFCYLVIYSLTRQLGMKENTKDRDSWKKIFSDKFRKELSKITLTPTESKHKIPVVTNTIFLLASQVKRLSPELKKYSHELISKATKKQPKYSEPWREAVQRIGDFYGNRLADGTKIDTSKLYDDLKKKIFPNKYSFQMDDGKALIKGKLSREEASQLIKAMKVVRKEFFKIVPHSLPVRGDRNQNFTLVCYPSKQSYKQWHSRFFGLSTDNGGIYIESVGTLYTYQRKPHESIYTFQELALHEFVHYLDGRYNIYGGFYERGTPYKKYNIDWYLEGLAECLVGSTTGKGVLPRKKLLRQVMRKPMTVKQIITASYKDSDPFAFYPHSGVFFCFLVNKEPELLKQMFRVIRNNDKQTMRTVFENMKKNKKLQSDYDAYLKKLQDGLTNGKVKFFEDQ